MQNKHQFFFLVLGVPTFGEGGGSPWLGQIPKFFQKLDLKASLTPQTICCESCDGKCNTYHTFHCHAFTNLVTVPKSHAYQGDWGVEKLVFV